MSAGEPKHDKRTGATDPVAAFSENTHNGIGAALSPPPKVRQTPLYFDATLVRRKLGPLRFKVLQAAGYVRGSGDRELADEILAALNGFELFLAGPMVPIADEQDPETSS